MLTGGKRSSKKSKRKYSRQAERAHAFLQIAGSHQVLAAFVAGLGYRMIQAMVRSNRSFPLGTAAFSNERRGLARAYLVPGGTWSMGRMRNGREKIRGDFSEYGGELGEPGVGLQ